MRRFVFTLALAGSFIATATPAPRPQTPTAVIPENSQPSTVVVIDAGHGGFDRGGIPRQVVQKKTMNLDVAQRLKAVLTAYGYRVVMTRDSDVFVPLGTRVAIANSYRDAIFVCIHFNAAPRRTANEVPRVRQNRHRRRASILPTRIRRKRARPEKRNRPPRKRRISWNRPC